MSCERHCRCQRSALFALASWFFQAAWPLVRVLCCIMRAASPLSLDGRLCHARAGMLVRCASCLSSLASPRVSLLCRLGWLDLGRGAGNAGAPLLQEAEVATTEHRVALVEGEGEEVGQVRPWARLPFAPHENKAWCSYRSWWLAVLALRSQFSSLSQCPCTSLCR